MFLKTSIAPRFFRFGLSFRPVCSLFLSLLLLAACGDDGDNMGPGQNPQGPEPTPTPFTSSASVGYQLLESWEHLDEARPGKIIRFSSSNQDPGSNEDFNQFLREEGRDVWVLAEHDGPGVVTRIWMTGRTLRSGTSLPGFHANAVMKVYIDGAATPLFAIGLNRFFSGAEFPFRYPLVNQHINRNVPSGLGFYSYVPISFNSSLKITVDAPIARDTPPRELEGRYFYQIDVVDLGGTGQAVENSPVRQADGSLSLSSADQAAFERIQAAWRNPGQTSGNPGAESSATFAGPAAGTSVLADLEGPGRIRGIRLQVGGIDTENLEKLRIRATWDNAATSAVEFPLSAGWGNSFRRARFEGLYQGALANNTFYLNFPMPFRERALVELVNTGNPQSLQAEVLYDTGPVRDDALYFHARFHQEAVEGGTRYLAGELQGTGHFVGIQLGVQALQNHNVLEGDEVLWVDGQRTVQGTGMEDFFNAHWFFEGGTRSAALHGATWVANRYPPEIEAHRFLLSDAVSFDQNLRIEWENANPRGYLDRFRSVYFAYLDRP